MEDYRHALVQGVSVMRMIIQGEVIPAHHIAGINNRVSSLALRVSDADALVFRLRWR